MTAVKKRHISDDHANGRWLPHDRRVGNRRNAPQIDAPECRSPASPTATRHIRMRFDMGEMIRLAAPVALRVAFYAVSREPGGASCRSSSSSFPSRSGLTHICRLGTRCSASGNLLASARRLRHWVRAELSDPGRGTRLVTVWSRLLLTTIAGLLIVWSMLVVLIGGHNDTIRTRARFGTR